MSERVYLYNLDAYIGYVDKIGEKKMVFVREDTTHCFRVEKVIKTFNLLSPVCNVYGVLVETRTYDRNRVDMNLILARNGLSYYDEWELFKKCKGRFINDTVWIETEKVPGSRFWDFPESEALYRKDYERAKREIPNF